MKHTLKDLIAEYKDELNGLNALVLKSVCVAEGDRDCHCILYKCGDELALQEEEGYNTVIWPEQYYEVVGLTYRYQALDILNPIKEEKV
jgi:hypothetical protein